MLTTELISIIAPALVAGLMIAITHAPLGIEVLKRGVIFIDLAVAQIAGLGLITAATFFHEPSFLIKQGMALLFAFMAGLFFRRIEITMPKYQEAIIGVSFVLSASLAILLLANHPHGSEEIQHLLSGQILFVSWHDVIWHAPIYALILGLWFLKPCIKSGIRSGIGFYFIFAVAITSSVQLVGVYIVFASLILPALATINSKNPHRTAWICGILSVIIGMVLAALTNLPAGPILVMSFTAISFLMIVKKATLL
ncbi:MAG: zinc/manganese transport system permease protein [Alphaproteobacteria bacterium]|jgi:zinc/manganese transport system permease protein